jgi:hypothetical protein
MEEEILENIRKIAMIGGTQPIHLYIYLTVQNTCFPTGLTGGDLRFTLLLRQYTNLDPVILRKSTENICIKLQTW